MAKMKRKSRVKGLNSDDTQKELWSRYEDKNTFNIALVREPYNEYDNNAVAYTIDEIICGHVDKELAARIAPLMDEGWLFIPERVEVKSVFGDDPDDYDYFIVADMMLYGISPDAKAKEREDYDRVAAERKAAITHRAKEVADYYNQQAARDKDTLEQAEFEKQQKRVRNIMLAVLAVVFLFFFTRCNGLL